MIVDTSAVIAIVFQEPEAERFSSADCSGRRLSHVGGELS